MLHWQFGVEQQQLRTYQLGIHNNHSRLMPVFSQVLISFVFVLCECNLCLRNSSGIKESNNLHTNLKINALT